VEVCFQTEKDAAITPMLTIMDIMLFSQPPELVISTGEIHAGEAFFDEGLV
jgi:hypothetical protein